MLFKLLPGLIVLAVAAGWFFMGLTVAGWGAATLLLIYIGYQRRVLQRIEHWLNKPSADVPQLPGLSGVIVKKVDHLKTRERRHKQRLERALKQFTDATNAMPDGVLLITEDRTLEWYSPSAGRFLGLRRGDINCSIDALMRVYQLSSLFHEDNERDSVQFDSPLDSEIKLELRNLSIGAGRRLVLIRDITQIERVLTMRRDFVANVSHELRTPLTVIMGYLEAMIEDDLEIEYFQLLAQKMSPSAHRMKALVEDLLLLSGLETKEALNLDDAPAVSVSQLIRLCLHDASSFDGSKHQISVSVDETLCLRGVEKELHSLCSNLINNAVRYTPDGGSIQVFWGMQGDCVEFRVEDTGAGIPAEHIGRLTERFYRVDTGRSREVGGTGLGLSIVKQILRRHNSRLQIKSKLGQGSCFSCQFVAAQICGCDKSSMLMVESVTDQ